MFLWWKFDVRGRDTKTMSIEIKVIASRRKKVQVKVKKQYWQRFLTY